jgi:hypothetical protein
MSDRERINGNTYSWSSTEFHIGDDRITGVKSIEYGDSRERALAYGMNRSHAPIGRSAGKYTPDPVKVTVLKSTADAIRASLARQAGTGGPGNAESTIVVQYTEDDLGSVVDIIRRCTLTKQASKVEENPDPLYEDMEFQCLTIDWNSGTLYDSTGQL